MNKYIDNLVGINSSANEAEDRKIVASFAGDLGFIKTRKGLTK